MSARLVAEERAKHLGDRPRGAPGASVIMAAVNRRWELRRRVAIPAAAWLLAVSADAAAQCPDPVERVLVFPEEGASGVPTNTVLRAELPRTRAPLGRPSWVVLDVSGAAVPGEEAWDGATATFTPDGGFLPRAAYYARVNSDLEHWNLSFVTGTEEDGAAPTFSGLSRLSWHHRDSSWLEESCSLYRGAGFVMELELPEADDDGDADELCYYVYQTEGPDLDAERVVARVRREAAELRLLLSDEEGEGHVCYRVLVRDLAGRFNGRGRERCADPIVDQVFHDACAAAPGRPSGWGLGAAAFLGLLALRRLAARPRGGTR